MKKRDGKAGCWLPPDPRGRRHADLVEAQVVEARRRERVWWVGFGVALLVAAVCGWAAEVVWGRGAPAMMLGSAFRNYCAGMVDAAAGAGWLDLLVRAWCR